MNTRVPQVLLQSFVAAEGLIANFTVEGRSMGRRVLQVLIKSLFAAEGSITTLTVEGRSMRWGIS